MSENLSLEALMAGLARPGVLPGSRSNPVEIVQTHISAVFLVGESVYKLKKPVDFGFLDFSTPQKRAFFCREELRLNRRLAPDIYIGLAPLWIRPGGILEVGDPSENPPPADELLVVMARMPADRMMDRLLGQGAVEPVHMERLARLISAFHARAEAGPEITRFGTREAAGALALENFDQTTGFIGEFFDPVLHAKMRARTAGFLETRERLWKGRLAAGRVRDVHGDLHSPNICILEDGRPLVYDCIEFSPGYRCSDVASDVAFLAMDLEFRKRADLADIFTRTYQVQSDDPTLGSVLPFFKAYRAMVRAKVSALTASAPEVSIGQRSHYRTLAMDLFALAERYTRGLTPPALVVLSGLTGVGKTSVAQELSRQAGWVTLETDQIRKELAGLDPNRPAPAGVGEGIYTRSMTEATYSSLARRTAERLERGETVLAVGTFVARSQRDWVRATAKDCKVPLLFARLVASEDVVMERLDRRPPGMSDGNIDVYREMARRQDLPLELMEAPEYLEIDNSGQGPGEVAELILERLRRPFEAGV